MSITTFDPTSRIERFQSLEEGAYWMSKEDIGTLEVGHAARRNADFIPAGIVILLSGIDYFGDKPHTIHLDGHPLLHPDRSFKFLVDDFLAKFEPSLDADQVRSRELATLQVEINRLQNELMEGQSNPALMLSFVEEKVFEWEQKNEIKASTLPSALETSSSMSTSVTRAISQRITESDVTAMRVRAERQGVVAKAQSDWIQARTTAISDTFSKMSPFFLEKASVALAKTKSIRDYAANIMKGLESMDLYIGKGVEVVDIAKGKSASADERLTLFQRKLFMDEVMDEEFAAWANVGENFDYEKIAAFDKAIAENPSLRDQIFPSPRAVVSMAVRRSSARYEGMDNYEAARRNLSNKSVFLMVRDGENIFRVYSAQPTHEATARLFPTKDELNNLFKGVDGADITFNDINFTEKVKQSDAYSLHYKRFLILLCGLDHRLNLFGRFYDPAEYGKFISLEFQANHFCFVTDDEPNFMLGEGKKPVLKWLAGMNRYLQSGSRVMCYYPKLIDPNTAPSCQKESRSGGSLYVVKLAAPEVDSELKVAYRDGKEICVEVRVKRDTWRDVVNLHFNARVSLSEAQEQSYLCLDAVKADEIDYYIHNRESRIQHINFIRLFKEISKTLRDEAATEVDTRSYLHNCVKEAGFAEGLDIDDVIDTGIRVWRAANRGKELPASTSIEELHPLLDQVYALCKTNEIITRADKFIAESGLIPLKLTMTGRNKLVLYTEVPKEQRDERLFEWRWVKRIVLNVLKTKLSVGSESLVWLTEKSNGSETELKVYENLVPRAWINAKDEPFKPDALSKHYDLVDRAVQDLRQPFCCISDDLFWRLLIDFERILNASKKMVNNAYIAVPIATYVTKDYNGNTQLHTVMLFEHAATWLWNFGNELQRKNVREIFIGRFQNKKHAMGLMTSPMKYGYSVYEGTLDQSISVFESGKMCSENVPGLKDAWKYGKGRKVRANESSWTATDYFDRSLNHAMQSWVVNEKFEELCKKSIVKFNPIAWDGKRSHLEKYLTEGISIVRKVKT